MTAEMTEEAVHKVERYLFRLGVAMGNLPASERDENVREIRAHILDRIKAEGGPLAQAVDALLQRLGTPEQLAASFERELSLARASRSSSPMLWLRTTAVGRCRESKVSSRSGWLYLATASALVFSLQGC